MDKNDSSRDRATTHDTVDAIAGSTQRDAFPLRHAFIQQKHGTMSVPGPLARFVTAGDRTALVLYFLALTKASTEPWDVALHSAVWARALGLPEPNGHTARGRVSKAWTRLVDRRLVTRSRRNRTAEFTLLCEDGSGDQYTRPSGKSGDRFIKMPHALWIEGPTDGPSRWFEVLSLPELSFLLIARSNFDGFALPVERGPDYYGISADTLSRGYRGLRDKNLLEVHLSRMVAPLAPEGYTYENRYTLKPPFGPRGLTSTAASVFR